MRFWFSFIQLPASCGNPLVQSSLADAAAAGHTLLHSLLLQHILELLARVLESPVTVQ